ncbi:MAG: hypothetical protein Q4E90_03760, partial [Collinsella sp.]|nr:hypothetical protein [Collinsella sp.]
HGTGRGIRRVHEREHLDLPAGSSLVLQEFLAVNYQRLRVIFPAYGMEASVHAQDDGAEEQLVARVIT